LADLGFEIPWMRAQGARRAACDDLHHSACIGGIGEYPRASLRVEHCAEPEHAFLSVATSRSVEANVDLIAHVNAALVSLDPPVRT
jgi:hypothetical protein